MPEDKHRPAKRVLEPMERISEVLFGLIMVLTITCSFSVAGAGHTEVRQMLIGALGCNLAWGVIDAVLYWMACFSARGQGIVALQAVQATANAGKAHNIIADAIPPLLASVISAPQFEEMRLKLNKIPVPDQPRLTKDDWRAGVGVFLLVFLATLPVILPFAFVHEPARALRISNGIAIALLFLTGYAFGRHAGHRPWRMGFAMVIVSTAMVGMTIALGG
jgi:VIT1/CCC1 family predicted Fe2+/Mn2+ transporter